jgi:predicted MFS family arabinose efflux permease
MRRLRLLSPAARIGPAAIRYYLDIPAPIRVLSAGVLINRAGGFISTFLPLILATRGMPTQEIGAGLVFTGSCTVAGAWLGGLMTTRFGSRAVIIVALTACAAFTVCLVPASPYVVTVGVAGLASLCNRCYIPAASTLVGRCSPAGRRLQMFSTFQTTFNVGNAIGLALAGYLISHSLTALLLVDAATSAGFVLVALRLPRDIPQPEQGPSTTKGQASDKVSHDLGYLVFCAGVALFVLMYQQNVGPMSLAFRAHHYSLELLGDLFSANAVAIILFQIPVTSLTRKLPVRVALALGVILTGGGYLVLLAGFTLPLLCLEIAFWTLGEMVFAPAAPTAAAHMSSSRGQGRFQGALDVARSSGQALGAPLGVFAYSAGPSVPWWGSGVIGVIAAAMFLIALQPGRSRVTRSESGERTVTGVATEST